MTDKLRGIVSPNLTPFNDDLSVAEDLYLRHARWLLDHGCAAITPFGTTGEALSVGMNERKHLLELLVENGIPADRLMVGTGLTNLPDTAELSRHAMALGCIGVMVLPPFYFKGVSDDGIHAYFTALIEAVPDIRIYLYHIPPVAVVGFGLALIKRLQADFPEHVVGLKDSSGDWDNTRAILDGVPALHTFPGSEVPLLEALRIGASGCITATANINAVAIHDIFTSWQADDADERQAHVKAFRLAVQPYAPIPAMKWLLADASGDARWKTVRPPLDALPDDKGRALKARLEAGFDFRLEWS
ncbi:MAG: dihydrodipicolinate synthase family protein [Rhodospirillales bacterium]|nr:dihydrodipicolinate synthase family protein [Rhodospirillales bacterium]